jgi:phosphoribosylglycinamide formyltransferase 1
VRVGVLVSGKGTNLQALIDAEAAGTLAPATLACVISNKPDVQALDRARDARIDHFVVPHVGRTREAFEDAMLVHLRATGVELVVLAGFMRVLTSHFVDQFRERIINTHPSLLPAFPGADAPAQAIAAGATISGATVHFVDASLDGGPIIERVEVPVEVGDDAASLHARIQRAEHRLLPDVVRRLAAGELVCEGHRVTRGTRAE